MTEIEIVKEINNAGLILIGNDTPSSVSDYCVGTNHVFQQINLQNLVIIFIGFRFLLK